MKPTILFFACAIPVAVLSAALYWTGGDMSPYSRHKRTGHETAGPTSTHKLSVLWLSDEVFSAVERLDLNTVRLHLKVNDPFTPSLDHNDQVLFDWSVEYEVKGAAGALGPHEFVLIGVARNGDVVLEHFDLDMPEGSQVFASPASSPPSVSIVGGGAYVPPSQRAAANPPTREELYRGSGLGVDLLLANDPDGRFSYVLSRDNQTLQTLAWETGAITEFTLGPDAAYLQDATQVDMREHATEGRKLKVTLSRTDGNDFIVLSDYDGDGLFDDHVVLSQAQYESLGYDLNWTSDFVNHMGFVHLE